MLADKFLVIATESTKPPQRAYFIPASGTTTAFVQVPLETAPDQSWYWTREWQVREAEADRDLAEGRVVTYNSPEEFILSLGAADE